MQALRKTVLALGLMCSAALAQASVIVLDFEGIGDFLPVGNYYNGGGGPNYGVSFSPDALGLVDAKAGGSGSFANEPSPSTAMFFVDANGAYLNYAAGFGTGFSFFYSSAASALVSVYDGLNASGNLLASMNLDAQFNRGCSENAAELFCNFSAVGISFEGIAKSIGFGGASNQTLYDDITFGSTTPGDGEGGGGGGGDNGVPEPTTLALLGLALASLGVSRRCGAKLHC